MTSHSESLSQQQVQVPKHVLRVFSDEGGQEKVEIQVLLPGVSSASDISVRIEPPDTVRVQVPNRYQLHLKLAVPIAAQADTVRFKGRTSKLTMHCLVVGPERAEVTQQTAQHADAGSDALDDANGTAPQAAQQAEAVAQADAPQADQRTAQQAKAGAGAGTLSSNGAAHAAQQAETGAQAVADTPEYTNGAAQADEQAAAPPGKQAPAAPLQPAVAPQHQAATQSDMDGTAAIGAALDLLLAAVAASERRAAADSLASTAQTQQHPGLPLHLPVAPKQQLPVTSLQQLPVTPQRQFPVASKQQQPVAPKQQQQEATSSSAGEQQQQHLRAELLRRGFSAVVGTQTTATCQAMQAALPALSSGDPEAAARALHTVLSAVLNSINSGDAATGTKALHAALKMNPTHDEATLLLQQLLQLHKTKQPQQQQPQQQQQQQPVTNSHATSITTASTSSGGSSSSTVGRSSSIGGRRSSEGSESRSTSVVVRNPVTATSTSSSTTSTTAGSTPPTSELHDLEDFDAISLLVFSRREKLKQHLGSFDGSTAMSREWVGEALRLKQQMVSSHARNLVGWWCSLMDYFSYWMLFCCLHMARWAGAGVSAGRVRGWPRLHSVLLAVHAGASDLYFVLISVVQLAWVLAWFFPHFVGFTVFVNGWLVLRRQHQRRATLPADIVASRTHLVTTEALQPAVIKLLLASCTGAILWLLLGLVWLLLCKAWWLVGTTWWLLCWPWVNLVWRPNLYLQVQALGAVSTPFMVWACLFLCGVICPSHTTTTWVAGTLLTFQVTAFQVMLAGGHSRVVASFVVSVLWLHNKTHWRCNSASAQQQQQQQQPPWWQASLLGVAYPVARACLSCFGAGWVLDVPNYVVAGAMWAVFELCWGLGCGVTLGIAGLVGWLLRWLRYGPVLWGLFAIFILQCGSSGDSGKVWERSTLLVAAALAVGTGSLDFLLPVVSWVGWGALGALAWLSKPQLYVATSLLWRTLVHLVPLPLLDRMSLRFCDRSQPAVMHTACSFVGHVQLVAQAEATVPVFKAWWGDPLLCCWVVYVLAAQALAWCLVWR